MCNCTLFNSEDNRSKLLKEIKSFKQEEFIYAALPYGAYTTVPDPMKMIVSDKKHIDMDRLTKYKVNNNLHTKFIIGRNKVIWGTGNFTENSIFNQHETYQVIYKDCCKEKYQKLFKQFQKLWERGSPVKREVKVDN